MGAVFTIPSHLPFLDMLVAGLRRRLGKDPLALAQVTILLPTRRAVRALSEAFLRASGGQPLLLPRLTPVGDLDAEELALTAEEGADGDAAFDIPPAVPEQRRRLMLTRLVLEWGRRHGDGPLSPGQAAPLAIELARFLDEVQGEACNFADLAKLVPEEYAEHWQQVLKFLAIVTEAWPEALAAIGCLDPAERRNRLLRAQIAAWRARPPAYPVIAAGITAGLPAVAELVATVAETPQGIVVLPGLDTAADDETWAEIAADPSHPQHLLARLLRRLELDPAAVALWPAARKASAAMAARRRLISEALRPAASCDRWRRLVGINGRAIAGLRRLDCPGPREEGVTIALLLRETLETEGAVAALVTPDRSLARRVAAELRRWDIDIDDSAGLPLERTPPGVFLGLILEAVTGELAPLPLLALLKHPLAACGHAPEILRGLARSLEMRVLRGPRPPPGLAGLSQAVASAAQTDRALAGLVGTLTAALSPLIAALAVPEIDLGTLVSAHIAAAEALALSDQEAGAARLWHEPAGEAAAQVMGEIIEAADAFPKLAGRDYPALIAALTAGSVVRPVYGRHPRLFIWGLLEARLQHADRIVLGGLNEGVWPPLTESDPWLSRPMRRRFGLAEPERRIGIAGHDFAQALGVREVVMTRASRVEGTPTVPSRWLLRLDAVLDALGLRHKLGAKLEPLAWQAALDRPTGAVAPASGPPAPRPPVAARPRQLPVTEIETWMRDPYAIYARHVLRLRPLEPLDADPGAAERGSFIHAALDRFLREFPGVLPEAATAKLLAFGAEAFGAALARPGVRAFWWPRFERIAHWFVAIEAERRQRLVATRSECGGSRILEGSAGPFRLTAKADRIDRLADGTIAILDYKTGLLPRRHDVELGFSPQLPLEAAIAEAGGFAEVSAAVVSDLAFWKLGGGDPPGEIVAVAPDAAAVRGLIDQALAGLRRLIIAFDDPATPYLAVPRPEWSPRYSDYRHLARVQEWSVTAEREG